MEFLLELLGQVRMPYSISIQVKLSKRNFSSNSSKWPVSVPILFLVEG